MRTIWPEDFYKQTISSVSVDKEKQKIIDRVMKLLSLAEGTNHLEEADSARKKAITLMAKHAVSVVNEQRYVVHTERARNTSVWKIRLYTAVCKFCGVKLYTRRSGDILYVGNPVNIANFQYMLGCVIEQMEQGVRAYTGDDAASSWKSGFALGVSHKIDQLEQEKMNKVHEWGLVAVDETKQAATWFEAANTVTREYYQREKYSGAGYAAGRAVSLNQHQQNKQKEIKEIG